MLRSFIIAIAVACGPGCMSPVMAQADIRCNADLTRVPAEQLKSTLEAVQRLNCDMDRILDQMKAQPPAAWKLLEAEGKRAPVPDLAITLTVRVDGILARYPATSSGAEACTRGPEIAVPQGKRVSMRVTSLDLIYKVHVPRLAQSVEAVPGRLSELSIDTSKTDKLTGRHNPLGKPGNEFTIKVLEPAAFAAWRQAMPGLQPCPNP